MAFKITVEREVTDELLFDLVVTACEGGTGYWLKIDHLPYDGRQEGHALDLPLQVWEVDDDNAEIAGYTLTLEGLKLGLERLAALNPDALNDIFEEQYDITHADNVFQLAILGEIRYG